MLAEDKSASVEARVSVFAGLVGELHPDVAVSYQDVSGAGGDPGPGGVLIPSCSSSRLAGDYGESQLTRADIDRIRRTAKRLREDATQPPTVR